MKEILIVDDMPANLRLLSSMLRDSGYKVRPVPNGFLALQAVENAPPDLILLDINMPDMSGYEVCERLKSNKLYSEIPVIFISALNETSNKLRAFHVGGVDYITKPFRFEEVKARVHTHLTLNHLRLQLEQQNSELTDKNQQLQKLEQYRDELVHMIVHDLKSPLAGILGYLDLLMVTTVLGDEQKDYVDKAYSGTETLLQMINSLLDVHRLESGQVKLQKSLCSLSERYYRAMDSLGSIVLGHDIVFETPDNDIQIECDSDLIERVFINLLSNAIRYSPKELPINISVAVEDKEVAVRVKDGGAGIPVEYHEKIFEKFGQVELHRNRQKYSSGLGLAFCKLAIEAHDGRIGVISEPGMGSEFKFTLPMG